MPIPLPRVGAATALLAATALPAQAQTLVDYAPDVAFFERAAVGEVGVTPIAVLRDTRCADARLCTRGDRFVVSALLHYQGDRRADRREILLELDRPIAVPGGFLVLRSAGTRPAFRGAIALDQYRLAFEYVPLREGLDAGFGA